MKEFIKIIVIAALGYGLILSGKLTKYILSPLKDIEWIKTHYEFLHFTTGNLIWIGLALILTYLLLRYFLNSQESIFNVLGLSNNILKGIGIGLLFTLPMFIGYAYKVGLQENIKFSDLITYAVYPGFAEELVYRAFFIGLLFRYTRLGFFPIVLLVSALFGAAHLYQGESFMHSLMIMLITGIGSMFFAWLFIEYKWNLWIPITMHTLMNLCWNIFALNTNDAAGNGVANTFRIFAIVLAVMLTLYKIYKQSSALKGKLIWEKS